MTDDQQAAESIVDPATQQTMVIERDRVVSFHYTLTEQDGDMSETSTGGEPLTMLFGYANVIPGVENALAGHIAGDNPPAGSRAPDRFWVTSIPPRSSAAPRAPLAQATMPTVWSAL